MTDAPRPVAGGLRPRRGDVLLAAAMAFGAAVAERTADAIPTEELAARFAIAPETRTQLCALPDGRTVPALLKHQVVNAIDKLDRIGMLPVHPGLSVRAISDVLEAVASFDTCGIGAAASQRQIARRARYSKRHVRDVLRYAATVGFIERCPRWSAVDRTPSGALEPVTDDRETVYVVHIVPRPIARGASDELLLELASPATPPLRRRVEEQPSVIAADVPASADSGSEFEAAPQEPPSPPPRERSLPPALYGLVAQVDHLAALTGIHLDAVDIATLGTAKQPDGYGLAPEHVLEAMAELHEKIRDGECLPKKNDLPVRWSHRLLRGRIGSFFRAKRRRLEHGGEPAVAEQARLRCEAAEREAANERRKERESREWEARRAAVKSDACAPAECRASEPRPFVPMPAWLREQGAVALSRALDACGDPQRAAELRTMLDEIQGERAPP